MRYLLDTNAWIIYLKDPGSVTTVQTLLAPFQCFPFDETDAAHYARLRQELEVRG